MVTSTMDASGPYWQESRYFDFVSAELSGFVRVGTQPGLDATWLWVVLLAETSGHEAVVHIDHHATLVERTDDVVACASRRSRLEVRCEDHEGGARIHVVGGVGVELDLRWRDRHAPFVYANGDRFEVAGSTSGTVTIGGRLYHVAGTGQRDRSWGPRDWWRFDWTWLAALDPEARYGVNVTDLHVPRRSVPCDGYWWDSDEAQRVGNVEAAAVPAGSERSHRMRVDGQPINVTPATWVEIPIPGPHRSATMYRVRCSFETPLGPAQGWLERHVVEPRSRSQHAAV